jgi:SNF2 family DNA or RNA helicase/predicted transcriptional regulator
MEKASHRMKIPDKYTLMPFQRLGVEYIVSRKYCLLGDDMGLGKSLQALAAVAALKAKRVLIICPGMLVEQWLRLSAEWNIGHDHYYIGRVDASVPICNSFPHWLLVSSYGYASTNNALRDLSYDLVVIDESHALKNPTAKRTKRILGKGSLLKNAERVVLMSGTPILNRPAELYIMLKTFCPDLLGKYVRWDLFVRRYCGFAAKGATHTDELAIILKEFMLRRTKEEVLDQLPPVVEQKIYIEGIKVPDDEFLPTLRRLIAEQKTPHIVGYIKEILQTVDKILLICYHRDTIKEIQTQLQHNAVTIYGGQDHELRERNLTRFKTDPECRVLIGQINTIGFGVDGLQHVCDRIVFGEIDWSPGVLAQAIDRLRRFGQTKTVFVDYIIAKGTLEERIDSKLKWKRKVIKELTETETMPPKKTSTPKVAGLEDAVNLFARLIAGHLAELINENTPTLTTTTVLEDVTAAIIATEAQVTEIEEGMADARAGRVRTTEQLKADILDDEDGMELIGAPTPAPKADVGVAKPVAEPVQITTVVEVIPALIASPSEDVTIQTVSDRVYALLEVLEEGGVPKQAAMDYYRNQLINGLSASQLKGLKPSELVQVNDKLDRIDPTKLIANLKQDDDGGI